LTGRNPDYIPLPDLLDRVAPALHPADARCHDEGLAERMSVPCRPSSGIERDAGARRACRIVRLELSIDPYGTSSLSPFSVCRPYTRLDPLVVVDDQHSLLADKDLWLATVTLQSIPRSRQPQPCQEGVSCRSVPRLNGHTLLNRRASPQPDSRGPLALN
jgi:hypothetical protein